VHRLRSKIVCFFVQARVFDKLLCLSNPEDASLLRNWFISRVLGPWPQHPPDFFHEGLKVGLDVQKQSCSGYDLFNISELKIEIVLEIYYLARLSCQMVFGLLKFTRNNQINSHLRKFHQERKKSEKIMKILKADNRKYEK
jgi:hypothetical protein